MLRLNNFTDNSFAVFGLGKTGLSTIQSLTNSGLSVIAWDDNHEKREEAKKQGIELVDFSLKSMDEIDYLLLSPGVPLTHPAPHWCVKKAYQSNIPIIGDAELFFQEITTRTNEKPPIVAITGTNGKSTTTALIGHILKAAGILDVQVGGNIGSRAILEFEEPSSNTVYVLELSSYQIDLTPSINPDVGIFLNLSPDHLDRHGTMDNYANVKMKLFHNMKKGQAAIIGVNDAWTKDAFNHLKGNFIKVAISNEGLPFGGVGVDSNYLFDDLEAPYKQIMDLTKLENLPGKHNWQNVAAAYAACRILGIEAESIAEGIKSFEGLAHRMEKVGILGDTVFINDSKATNVESAAKSLAMHDNILWILGGQSKEGGLSGLEKYFPRIKKAFLIGEASDYFASQLEGKVKYEKCNDLENAVNKATKYALQADFIDPVVLLSPACSSFDQFLDYEQRGNIFRSLVSEIKGILITSNKVS